ncbi:uncharacterized protein VICG_00587 [Vittaforma corneae ATCC 50505]|uniref:Uncharacterized protein n=1 Tax=Vittaforma corneae (strain ATCC 50505) TaxID=993615 RepID=L2GNL6_VITCO|nr:uncharacterized protein VICG_00587 [Vittaforma corneae ATCC 50505]ELA42488.1 hypothetical protein VICG_00587 [Vittaforma corneae ATCC 50505]
MALFLFFITALCSTLIIPKAHLNHRLSYHKNGAKFINSSVNENTRVDDYFDFPDSFSYLSSSEYSLCRNSNNKLYICPKSIKSMAWKLEDIRREVRFRDPYGDCLTVGMHNLKDDSYNVELKECSEKNQNQIFILFSDHGNIKTSEITRKNINSVPENEKNDFRMKNIKFKWY